MLDQPLHLSEFLAVDTETNGLARERCEMTEVGAVLVGGGELHDRWSSLVGVSSPLSPGIQRFTGISQEMVNGAPRARAGAAGARGADAGPRARRPQRQLRRAGPAPGLQPRGAGLARPAGDLHGGDGAAAGAAAAAARAGPARRRPRDRGRGDPPRAAGRRAVRAGLLRAVQAAVRQRADGRGGGGAARRAPRPARGGRGRVPAVAARAPAGPARAHARAGRVRVPRRGRPAAVRRQVDRRAQAGAPALHVRRAVDGARRAGRLRGDGVRARRAAARAPADPQAQAARPTCAASGSRTARSSSAAGWTSRSRSSRWRASPRRATPSASGPCAAVRRRRSWSSSSTRCSACGTARASCRAAITRAHTGRWAAACRPASATWTRTSTASDWSAPCGCSPRTVVASCSRTWMPRCARRRKRALRARCDAATAARAVGRAGVPPRRRAADGALGRAARRGAASQLAWSRRCLVGQRRKGRGLVGASSGR